MNSAPLAKAFTVKSLTLAGRTVMAPMTRSHSPGNIPGPDVAAYYGRRAKNKVALIITEGTVVTPAGHAYPDVPNFYGEAALAGWQKVVEAVHANGGKIFPQLWHAGSVRQPGMGPDTEVPSYGPSAVKHPSVKDGAAPTKMTLEEVESVIAAFATAAGHAQRLGFDGIEIHGAHGYLIDQFFWAQTNRRSDRFGGETAVQRTRFAVEIIEAIRREVGDDYPICLRFSQWKLGDYNTKLAPTPEDLAAFLEPLTAAGVDIFHCSSRRFLEPEFPGSTLNLAGWTKKITGKTVISVGNVGLDADFISAYGAAVNASPESVASLMGKLEADEFDLIAIGRALLADPEWVTKVLADRFDEIKPYTAESGVTLS